jgi:dihydroorotate dehydrogenase (fumarate)
VLYGRLRASLGATRGVHTPVEVVKYLMAGADVVMTTSALLKNGIDYLTTLRDGLQTWMEMHHYVSVAQMKGSMSQRTSPIRPRSSAPTTSRRWKAIRVI